MRLIVSLFLVFLLGACGSETTPSSMPVSSQNFPTILALGDSLTAGYRLPLEESYPVQLEWLLPEKGYNYRVQNAGTSGDTSAGLREKLSFILAGETPQIAIVVIGGNDLLQSLPTAALQQNLEATVDVLLAKNIRVIIAGIDPPLNVGPAYRKAFREVYTRVSQQKQVALYPSFLSGVIGKNDLMLDDGIHPNGPGYARIAASLRDFLIEENVVKK